MFTCINGGCQAWVIAKQMRTHVGVEVQGKHVDANLNKELHFVKGDICP